MVGAGGLVVIDLGLSVDIRGAEGEEGGRGGGKEVRFHGGRAASGYQCRTMRAEQMEEEGEGRMEGGRKGWREEADLYALGASAYCLLHGHSPPPASVTNLIDEKEKRKVAGAQKKSGSSSSSSSSNPWRLKRYWEQEVWNRVLTGLMDAETEALTPVQARERLDELIQLLERTLHSPKGKGVGSLLVTVAREMGPFLAGIRAGRV